MLHPKLLGNKHTKGKITSLVCMQDYEVFSWFWIDHEDIEVSWQRKNRKSFICWKKNLQIKAKKLPRQHHWIQELSLTDVTNILLISPSCHQDFTFFVYLSYQRIQTHRERMKIRNSFTCSLTHWKDYLSFFFFFLFLWQVAVFAMGEQVTN